MDNEIAQYKQQLLQIQQEISLCRDVEKKTSLIQLADDIKQLIDLTSSAPDEKESPEEDPIDAEYNLFRAELALDVPDEPNSDPPDKTHVKQALAELQEDLLALTGMKCQAPFKHAWSEDLVYHNALVYKVEANEVSSSEDIKVRVMFTNPTQKEMKPCPYYLEGECKFSDEKCHFSHGDIVFFNELKDYKEPNFTNLGEGSRVLVKQSDDLWYRAKVLTISDELCAVKLESSAKHEETHLQNILPLEGDADTDDSSSDSSDDDTKIDHSQLEDEICKRILNAPPTSSLGEWERYTKGFGSRLMAQMGYVHGLGLGAKAEGRVEPVPAVIYPVGKSLDHCMMLKEHAGGDQDLFKADRKMRRVQRKHEEALNRAYEREKQRTDVFTFLNDHLGTQKAACDSPSKPSELLKNQTQKGLNVTSLQLAEDVRKAEKEIKSIQESMDRQSSTSSGYATLRDKMRESQGRLSQLQASERKVSTELQQRKDRKKLVIF